MTWKVVPNLDEGRDQLNARFPNRDKASDGSIGDTSHAAGASSHNPDKTGSPEYRDGDSKDEIRARDFDKDLKDPDYTMEDVVQLWVKHARSGKMWWIRYIIYKERIWHKKDGFKTRAYTGKNKHTEHAHVNSDFAQKADDATGTNWHLSELKKKDAPVKPTPSKPDAPTKLPKVAVDGKLGPDTIKLWQRIMGTPVDGKISETSDLVKAVQRKLRVVDARLVVDGKGIVQDGRSYKTIGVLQRYLNSPVDQVFDKPVSEGVKALQRRLNTGKF